MFTQKKSMSFVEIVPPARGEYDGGKFPFPALLFSDFVLLF